MRLAPPPLALVAPGAQAADGRRAASGGWTPRRSARGSTSPACAACRTRSPRGCARAVPGAAVERRYGVVLDALALRLPGARARPRASACPAWPPSIPVATYHAAADTVPGARGRRPALGRRSLDRRPGRQGRRSSTTASTPARRSSRPPGCAPPPGFPRGQRRFTSGRVIVARSFAGDDAPRADHLAFDPNVSEHGTHVSGIVAGAYGTVARPGLGLPGRARASPASRPAPGSATIAGSRAATTRRGAIGSTVELAAAVDQAVADGMDVLNLSLGGPEIDPSADALVAGAGQRRARRRPLRRRRGQRASTRAATARSPRPARARRRSRSPPRRRTRVFGVSGTRQRRAARPRSTPFTAVPSIGPRVTRALDAPDAPRRPGGLRARPARLPRGAAAPRGCAPSWSCCAAAAASARRRSTRTRRARRP